MEYEEAYRAALRLLAVRPRTKHELQQRLLRHGAEPEVCRQVVEQLQTMGYLDDAAFAKMWVEERKANRPMGRFRLQYELRGKGVPKETVEEALFDLIDEAEEERLGLEAAQKRLRALANLAPEIQYRRLVSFLQRRGFPETVIRKVIRQLLDGINEEP